MRVDARRYVAGLCRRFHVSLAFGRRLEPLVELAARTEPHKRRLLLEVIERSFAEESRRFARDRASTPAEYRRALELVARVLHGWDPPAWMERE